MCRINVQAKYFMVMKHSLTKLAQLAKVSGLGLLSLLIFSIGIKNGQAKPTQQMRILVPIYPPYSEKIQEKWQGEGFDKAIQVLKTANIEYKIIPGTNFEQGFKKLKNNQIDAVLLATENDQRNQYAVLSKALICANWYWYLNKQLQHSPNNSAFKKQYKVASPFKANAYLWLEKKQYNVTGVLQVDNLAKMLQLNRVDAVMSPNVIFENAAAKANLPVSDFNMVKHSTHPVGIYIQKKYMANHPQTLKHINQAIKKNHPNLECE